MAKKKFGTQSVVNELKGSAWFSKPKQKTESEQPPKRDEKEAVQAEKPAKQKTNPSPGSTKQETSTTSKTGRKLRRAYDFSPSREVRIT